MATEFFKHPQEGMELIAGEGGTKYTAAMIGRDWEVVDVTDFAPLIAIGKGVLKFPDEDSFKPTSGTGLNVNIGEGAGIYIHNVTGPGVLRNASPMIVPFPASTTRFIHLQQELTEIDGIDTLIKNGRPVPLLSTESDVQGALLIAEVTSTGSSVTVTDMRSLIDVNGAGDGTGNVIGPGSSTNNAIVLWDSTSGTMIKDSTKLLPAGDVVGTTATQTLESKILVSPQLTGTPVAPTPDAGDNSDRVPTTEFVHSEIATALSEFEPPEGGITTPAETIVGNIVTWDSETGEAIADSGIPLENLILLASRAEIITQADHGFEVNQFLKSTGTGSADRVFSLALADTAENAEVVGFVSEVVDEDTFKLSLTGSLITIEGLDNGAYWLSDTEAGGYRDTPPPSGTISKVLFVVHNVTYAVFVNWQGVRVKGKLRTIAIDSDYTIVGDEDRIFIDPVGDINIVVPAPTEDMIGEARIAMPFVGSSGSATVTIEGGNTFSGGVPSLVLSAPMDSLEICVGPKAGTGTPVWGVL